MTAKQMAICVIALLSSGIALSGCATPSPKEIHDDPVTPPFVVDLSGTPPSLEARDPWGKLRVDASGAAGTWLVAYRQFPENRTLLEYSISMDIKVEGMAGAPLGVFVLPPRDATNLESSGVVDARLILDAEGQGMSYRIERDVNWSAGGVAEFTGIFFLVGASGPWRANVQVEFDSEGNETGPSTVLDGDGFTLFYPPSRSLNAPAGMVGSMSVEAQIAAPGLTHIETYWTSINGYRPGVRVCNYSFGEHRNGDCGSVRISDCNAGAWGEFPFGPGQVSISMDYLEVTEGVDLAIVHIPIGFDALPPPMRQMSYQILKDQNGPWCNP